ncbi:MAG: hypothetical protein O3B95_10635 [Chloroflexi bacterium]|nr:hypothetical protein [Chloroflexota bacterium]
MGLKENWWRLNYHILRLAVAPVVKKSFRFSTEVEGEIPVIRPIFLAPAHRTSIDIYAVGNVTDEFITYVSTDSFGHNRYVNWVQKQLTRALGSVIWQEHGLDNPRHRAVLLARDVDDRLDRRLIVAAFTQGEYQPDSVNTVEDGLLGLLRRYERRHQSQKTHELRIPVVPVGIAYDYHGQGLKFSRSIRWLADHVPLFPNWSVPALSSSITVRFGEPHYFDGRSAGELTEVVMRKAAELSGIPYKVKAIPEEELEP